MEVRIEGMVGYVLQVNGGISFLWIPSHMRLYKADIGFGLGVGGKGKIEFEPIKEIVPSASRELNLAGSGARNNTLSVSTKIEAEARYFGMGTQISGEMGFDGKIRQFNNHRTDTKGFTESSINLGYKPSLGGAVGIKWDAIRFQWKGDFGEQNKK